MADLSFDRWCRVCAESGMPAEPRDHLRVLRAWRSMGRHYHTVAHLEACLRELDDAPADIYHHDPFRERYEQPARRNIARALRQLAE